MKYLTTAEFADYFRMPEKTVRQRIRMRAGDPTDPRAIAAIDLGTALKPRYRIPVSEVQRYERRFAA